MLTPPEQMMIGILGGGTLVGAIFSFIQFLTQLMVDSYNVYT